MHSINPIFPAKAQISYLEPKPHKLLKKSLNITLKSVDRSNLPANNYTSKIGHSSDKFSKSFVNQVNQTGRNSLKSNIDNRLHKVYSLLAKHGSVNLLNKKQKEHTPLLISSKVKTSPFQQIGQSNPELYSQLPYEMIRQYISGIYSEYDIRDPLNNMQIKYDTYPLSQMNTPTKPAKMTDNKTSTKKKILMLKSHFIQELHNSKNNTKMYINGEGTQKKNYHSSNQSPYFNTNSPLKSAKYTVPVGSNTKRKLQMTLKDDEELFNQHSNQIGIGPYQNYRQGTFNNQKYRFDTMAQTKLSISSVKNSNFNSFHQKHSLELSNLRSQPQQKVSQLFRYCFVCEAAILQSNMSSHERECRQLKQILLDVTLTQEKMLKMINFKIQKIQNQISDIFIKTQEKQTISKLQQIKRQVMSWIQSINNEDKYQILGHKRNSLGQFALINEAIQSTNLIRCYELIKKLNWFIHLRTNFEQISLRTKLPKNK